MEEESDEAIDYDAWSNSANSLDEDVDFEALLDENNPDYPPFEDIVKFMNLNLDEIENAVFLGKPVVLPGSRPSSPFDEENDIIMNSTDGSEPYNTDEEREKDAEFANLLVELDDVPEPNFADDKEYVPDLPGYKSVRTILNEKLDILSAGIKVSRVVYLIKYTTGILDLNIGDNMTALVDDLNIHLGEDKLTGVFIYTDKYGIVMVEGSEYAITNHFKGVMNTSIRERFAVSKILTVAPHVMARWVDSWTAVACTLPVQLRTETTTVAPVVTEVTAETDDGDVDGGDIDVDQLFTGDYDKKVEETDIDDYGVIPGDIPVKDTLEAELEGGNREKKPDDNAKTDEDTSAEKISDKSAESVPASIPAYTPTAPTNKRDSSGSDYSDTMKPPEPLHDDIVCVYKCEVMWKYIAMQQLDGREVTPVPKEIETKLPTQELLEKCLSEKQLLTVERYTKMITTVPEFRDFHEHNVPAQGDEIPMNILNPFPGEEEALMESMILQKAMEKEAKQGKKPEEVKKEENEDDEE